MEGKRQTSHKRNVISTLLINILLIVLLVFPNHSYAKKKRNTGISIEKITVGEERIEAGRLQLIEVLIKNRTSKKISTNLKLMIILPNHNIITHGKKPADLPSKSETRILIPYPIDKNRGGDYTVSAKLYDMKGRVLAKSRKDQNVYFFAVDSTRRNQKSKRIKKTTLKNTKVQKAKHKAKVVAPIQFDPPDLLFKDIKILDNNSILRGETAHIRLSLINDGGDVATKIEYSIYWYFSHRPNRKVKFFSDVIKIIAPGERKVIEIPLTIPESEQKGEYMIQAVVDESNAIKENDEKNNASVSQQSLIFSDIALVFPADSHTFAENGLFKFEWRSNKYNQFKVQVSADKFFPETDDTFELPKGEEIEGWTPAKIIKPLAGEMPTMATSIMESNNINHLYWRVKAKDSQGATTESTIRKFFINLKADLQK